MLRLFSFPLCIPSDSQTLYPSHSVCAQEPRTIAIRDVPAESHTRASGDPLMQDVIMLLFTVAFFAIAFLYVKVCQKLR
jgi:hypothetical protein